MHQRQHFEALAEDLRRHLAEGEDFTLWYSAEDSEFIRFNRARVRQAGRVRQASALLRLIRDERQASLDLTLSGAPVEDRQRLVEGLRQLRQSLAWIPADPYLLLDTSAWQRENQDRQLRPGDYRAYLAPAALEEVMQMLCWGGFSARALATGESPLQRLQNGDALLSPLLNLAERPATSPSPAFSAEGSPRAEVELVGNGRLSGRLVSSRSAREYGLVANGAGANEAPTALDMAGGSLEQARILEALDTGLYIGNLWYLNYSDMPAARLTGMTRFATFWVENGQIRAPVSTMRFDDSLYSFLGAHLEDLSHERELRLSSNTYGERQTDSMHLPGALTGRFTLTL
ncbi:metallopeptidase TldD-related protein [Pseudomonas aeruginosa]|uniref:metallopeptidase TldD-related protein n=1 Tax=Pseudomonas aeruginosa TaxID=287 RepID=UPI0010500522|nr:metallopeptidase TldD-related protein [Pseudomonas aeruginosa]